MSCEILSLVFSKDVASVLVITNTSHFHQYSAYSILLNPDPNPSKIKQNKTPKNFNKKMAVTDWKKMLSTASTVFIGTSFQS
jgi:hypothetical protein